MLCYSFIITWLTTSQGKSDLQTVLVVAVLLPLDSDGKILPPHPHCHPCQSCPAHD